MKCIRNSLVLYVTLEYSNYILNNFINNYFIILNNYSTITNYLIILNNYLSMLIYSCQKSRQSIGSNGINKIIFQLRSAYTHLGHFIRANRSNLGELLQFEIVKWYIIDFWEPTWAYAKRNCVYVTSAPTQPIMKRKSIKAKIFSSLERTTSCFFPSSSWRDFLRGWKQ